MKLALSTLFLIIFSLQILPIKEISKELFNQELTHEVGEFGCDDSSENEPELNKIDECIHTGYAVSYSFNNNYVMCALLNTTNYIFRQYIADTPTPPPNLQCK